MPEVQKQLDSLKDDVRAISDTVDVVLSLTRKHDRRLAKVESRLSEHSERFDALDQQLSEHGQRFDALDQQMTTTQGQLTEVLRRLAS